MNQSSSAAGKRQLEVLENRGEEARLGVMEEKEEEKEAEEVEAEPAWKLVVEEAMMAGEKEKDRSRAGSEVEAKEAERDGAKAKERGRKR